MVPFSLSDLGFDHLFKKLVDVTLANASHDVIINSDTDAFGAVIEAECTANGDLVFQAVFGDEFFETNYRCILVLSFESLLHMIC